MNNDIQFLIRGSETNQYGQDNDRNNAKSMIIDDKSVI